jgi:hypothetical protein
LCIPYNIKWSNIPLIWYEKVGGKGGIKRVWKSKAERQKRMEQGVKKGTKNKKGTRSKEGSKE